MRRSTVRIVFSGLLGLLLGVGLLRLISDAATTHLNSDLLFIAHQYEDAFVNGRGLAGWNLPPAPYFFPDITLLFPAFALTGPIFHGYLLYGVLQFLALLVGFAFLLSELGVERRRAWWTTFIAGVLFVALLQGAHPSLLVSFTPIFHGGSTMAGVWLLALWIRLVRLGYSRLRAFWFVVFSIALSLSDLFSVTQFLIPIALVVVVAWRNSMIDSGIAKTVLNLIVLTAVCDFLILGLMGSLSPMRFQGNPLLAFIAHELGLLRVAGIAVAILAISTIIVRYWIPRWVKQDRSHLKGFSWRTGMWVGFGLLALASILWLASPDDFIAYEGKEVWPWGELRRFFADVPVLFGADPLLWTLAFVAPIACLWFLFNRDGLSTKQQDSTDYWVFRGLIALALLMSIFLSVMIAALEWVGAGWILYPGLDIYREGSVRHMQLVYVYPVFILAGMVAIRPPRFNPVMAMLALLIFAAWRIGPPALMAQSWFEAPQGDYQICLDRVIESRDLHGGYGTYWTARTITYRTETAARVIPLTEDFRPNPWVYNSEGFLPNRQSAASRRVYDFIVPLPIPVEEIVERFGEPAYREDCNGLEVLVYDRESDISFRNFARVPSLIEAGVAAETKIASPTGMDEWIMDGTPVAVESRPRLPADGMLEIELLKPVAGDVLELSVEAGAALQVTPVDVQGNRYEPLSIQPIAADGFRTRFRRLPDSGGEWASFELRSDEGSSDVALGHLFIHADPRSNQSGS